MKKLILSSLFLLIFVLFSASTFADYTSDDPETCPMPDGYSCPSGKLYYGAYETCYIPSAMQGYKTTCETKPTPKQFKCNKTEVICGCDLTTNVTAKASCEADSKVYNSCNNTCGGCASGYELLGGSCVSTAFYNGAGLIDINNSPIELAGFWTGNGNDIYNNNTGNVGIGTDSPSTALEVDGILTVANGGIKTDNVLVYTSVSVGEDMEVGDEMRVNGTFVAMGNVGIGTASPSAKLDVSGGRVEISATTDATGTANSGVLEIANTLRIDGNEIITNTNSVLYLQNDNNGDLIVDNSTFVVDSSANRVGIGTSSPSAKLSVIGSGVIGSSSNVASGSNSFAAGAGNTASGTNTIALGVNATADYSYAVAIGRGALSSEWGSVALGGYTSATGRFSTAMGYSSEASGAYSTAQGHDTTASGPSSFALGTSSISSGNRSIAMGYNMTVSGDHSVGIGLGSGTATVSTANVFVVHGGRVGIGDTSPDATLDVEGQIRAHSIYGEDNSNFVISSKSGYYVDIQPNSSTYGLIIRQNGDTGDWVNLEVTNDYFNIGKNNSGGDLRVYEDGTVEVVNGPNSDGTVASLIVSEGATATMYIDGNEIDSTSNIYLQNNNSRNVYVNGSLRHSSDRRLKKDIEGLDYGLKEVLEMNPVKFNWKNKENEKKTIGFIAQDMQLLVDEVVSDHADPDDPTILAIGYDGIIPVLAKAIQEQQVIIHDLISRIEDLEKK